MANDKYTIDFSNPTAHEASSSFGVARTSSSSTSLALDQLELRLELTDLPEGSVDIVLHAAPTDGASLGLAIAANGSHVKHSTVRSAHRLSIPSQHLIVGENIIRLSRIPLYVTSISADIGGTPQPAEAPSTGGAGGVEPLDFSGGTGDAGN